MSDAKLAFETAKKLGALYVDRCPDFIGKKVWCMIFYEPGDDIPQVGFPQYIFVENGECTISTEEQALSYMRFVGIKYGYDDEGNINNFKGARIRILGRKEDQNVKIQQNH